MTHELITKLLAVCIHEPRGEHNLEGYQRGESYQCELVEGKSPRYYRIWPKDATRERYQCALPRDLLRYFRLEEVA